MYAGEKWVCVRKSRLFQRPRFFRPMEFLPLLGKQRIIPSLRFGSMLLWEQHELFDCLKSATPISSSPKLHSGTWRSHTSRRPERGENVGERKQSSQYQFEYYCKIPQIPDTLELLKNTLKSDVFRQKNFQCFFSFLTFNAAHKQFSSIHSYSYEICTTVRRRSSTLYLM